MMYFIFAVVIIGGWCFYKYGNLREPVFNHCGEKTCELCNKYGTRKAISIESENTLDLIIAGFIVPLVIFSVIYYCA